MEQISILAADTISFPKLGITFDVGRTAFTVFGIEIMWYGIMIALGMLLAMIYCFKRTKEFGVDSDRLIDAVMAGVVGAVIGARLYYVALHADSFHDIKEVLAIRDGGLAIYGGIIGALLFGGIMAKLRKLRLPPVLDVASMGFLIGQCLGRWGNFFNQEAFGVNTTLPWGMTGNKIQNYLVYYQADLAAKGMNVDPYQPVHPCFLYESLWCLAGFLIVHFYYKKRKFDGEVFCIYVFWYGLGRFFIEGLRTDSLYIGSVRASQLLALLSCIAALAFIIVMRIKVKKKGEVTLYRDTEESKAIIAEAEKAEAEENERRRQKKHPELTEDQKIISDEDEEQQE
ncbi:MAG: prolipoprotein diacylglyceryl transferase [Huintestinicola sp.]